MSAPRDLAPPRRGFWRARNWLLLGAGLVTLAVGYAVLAGGHPSLAAVILVVGYLVLLPLGIAL